MSRIANPGNAAELQKRGILGCVAVDLDFQSGHVYANDGFHAFVFQGHTFGALGELGGINIVQEARDQIARPIVLTLSGVDPSLVATAQDEVYQNRSAIVYVALVNQYTGELVDDPEVAWEGRMDVMQIELDLNSAKITLNCEPRLRREPRIARYTDADQQQRSPGDPFLEYVPTIEGFKSNWGDQKVHFGNGPVRPGTSTSAPGSRRP